MGSRGTSGVVFSRPIRLRPFLFSGAALSAPVLSSRADGEADRVAGDRLDGRSTPGSDRSAGRVETFITVTVPVRTTRRPLPAASFRTLGVSSTRPTRSSSMRRRQDSAVSSPTVTHKGYFGVDQGGLPSPQSLPLTTVIAAGWPRPSPASQGSSSAPGRTAPTPWGGAGPGFRCRTCSLPCIE